MPDDPIERASGEKHRPEDKLRELIDRIEREESPPKGTPLLPEESVDGNASSQEVHAAERVVQDSDDDLLLSADELRLVQLEREIEATRAQHHEQIGEIKNEFTDRMNDLEGRLKRMREEREGKKSMELKQSELSAADSRGLGLGLSIAYTFIGLPLFGALVGWGIDRTLKTTYMLGICTIIGVAGGLAYTIMLMNRSNKT